MGQVFRTLCCFSSKPFLKELASHVSAATLQLKFPGMKFFLIHPRLWNIFFGRFRSSLRSVNERKKNRTVWWEERVSLIYCFNFFRNQLWQHLISYNSFRNMNMCLLEVAMCEKCRSSHFQSEGGVKKLRTGVVGGEF